MGICIDVQSIIPPPSRLTWGPVSAIRRHGELTLEGICKAFGWQNAPWEEPSERKGTVDTSCNYSRYSKLLSIAGAASFGQLFLGFDRLSLVERANRPLAFQHFIDRVDETNYYIPVEFATPVKFESLDNFRTINVGSSYALISEMVELGQVVDRCVQLYGHDTTVTGFFYIKTEYVNKMTRLDWAVADDAVRRVMEQPQSSRVLPEDCPIAWYDDSYPSHTWDGLHNLCKTLLLAAKESIELQLPVSVLW